MSSIKITTRAMRSLVVILVLGGEMALASPGQASSAGVPGSGRSSLQDTVQAASLSWSNWYSLGNGDSPVLGRPAVASWASGRLDIFAMHDTDTLYHRSYEAGSGFSGWDAIPGTVASAPAAVSWGLGRIDIVMAGGNDVLYHKAYANGHWYPWENLGMTIFESPAITSWGSGRLDVFALRASDLAMVHRAYANGAWTPWQVLTVNSLCADNPAAVSWGSNRIDVFEPCAGTDEGIEHLAWDGQRWTEQRLAGGTLDPYAGLAVTSWGPGRLDVFGVSKTGVTYAKAYHDGAWTGWYSMGHNPGSGPGGVSWGLNRIDLFETGPIDALWQDSLR